MDLHVFEIENRSARLAAVDFQCEIQLKSTGNRPGIWRSQLVLVGADMLFGNGLPDSETPIMKHLSFYSSEAIIWGKKYMADKSVRKDGGVFIETYF